MDFLIQQDGRVQMNLLIASGRNYYRTVESVSGYEVNRYGGPSVIPVERTFRKLGTEGDITVWVEVR